MLIKPKIMQIALVLFPEFSNLGVANAIEPLRAANSLAGRRLYDWRYLGIGSGAVRSSSGLPVTPEGVLTDASGDLLIVAPSYGHLSLTTPATLRALRAASRRFKSILGVDTGSWLLAAAGLLDGHRATCHWDVLTDLAEAFPEVDVREDRFVIDGNRLSSGGATTTLELMLHLIEADHGAKLAHAVAALFMHGERGPDLPPMPSPRLRAAAALMRRHLETPLSIGELARALGLSRRALEQAFRAKGGPSPAQLYRRIRLSEARRMVLETSRSVAEIAGRCGYADPAALTRAMRAEFGTTPRALRTPKPPQAPQAPAEARRDPPA